MSTLQEYNTYYNIKFGRNAKIVKKVEQLNGKSNGVHRKGSQQNLPRQVLFPVVYISRPFQYIICILQVRGMGISTSFSFTYETVLCPFL